MAGIYIKHATLRSSIFVLEDLEQLVAALGANSSFLLAFPDADRGAIIRVSYAHPVQIFGVEDVVLVTFPAAGLGLAGRALPLGAGPGVSLWVDYGEVRVAAFFVARGAGGWARDGRMGGLAGGLTGPFEAVDGDIALVMRPTAPAYRAVGLKLNTTDMCCTS